MARNFDGTKAIDVASVSSLSYPFTIMCWARATTFPTTIRIMGKWGAITSSGSVLLAATSTALFRVAFNAAGTVRIATGATTRTTGVWYHVCGTYDGTTLRIYVNGTQDGSLTTSDAVSAGSYAWRIGAGQDGNGWNGDLADAYWLNACLTPKQVLAVASGASPFNVAPDAMYGAWPLWGTDTPDYSGKAHPGASSSATVVNHPGVQPGLIAA